MVTGRLPFEGNVTESIINAILNQTPTRPSYHGAQITHELEAVILTAMVKSPRRRPEVAEMIEMLDRAIPPPRQTASIVGQPLMRLDKSLLRRRPPILAVLLGLLVVASFVAGVALGRNIDAKPVPTTTATVTATTTPSSPATAPSQTREAVTCPLHQPLPRSLRRPGRLQSPRRRRLLERAVRMTRLLRYQSTHRRKHQPIRLFYRQRRPQLWPALYYVAPPG